MQYRKILLTFYLIMLSAILPIYMKDGYYMLGEEKWNIYMIISAAIAGLIIFAYISEFIEKGVEKSEIRSLFKVFLCLNLINLAFSVDQKVSFFGIEGWRTGFITMFLMLFFCFAYSEGLSTNGYVLAAIFITPFVISIIVIAERFGMHVLSVSGTDPSFVACIGNINWYAGYLSIFAPLGIGFAVTRELFGKEFYFWSLYSIALIMSLLVQGSDSALLILIGTYGLLIWYCLYEKERLQALMIQLFILGLSMFEVKILLGIFPEKYTYSDNILIRICDMNGGIFFMTVGLLSYMLLSINKEEEEESLKGERNRRIYRTVVSVIATAALIFVMLRFDDIAGNGRGTIWRVTLDMYKELPSFRKIIGVGRDCFSTYAYSKPARAEILINEFGENRLTNAHSIFLTELIEGGLAGLVGLLFLAFYVLGSLKKCNKEKGPAAIICALPIVSYYLNGMVSFSHVLSTPYAFICLGIGLYVANSGESQIGNGD